MGLKFSKSNTTSKPTRLPVDQSNQLTAVDKAKLDVRKGKMRLTKWAKHLDKETGKLQEMAKRSLTNGNKEKALRILKIRKMKAGALTQAREKILNLEGMLLQIESQEISVEMAQAVKNGTEALNAIHKVMSVEAVEKLMEENEEALATFQEIENILADGNADYVDEDELEEELMALAGLDTASQMPNLPDAPAHEVTMAEEEIERLGESAGEKRKIILSS
jgi:hypothetical protein